MLSINEITSSKFGVVKFNKIKTVSNPNYL
jgi:hypothetical protein